MDKDKWHYVGIDMDDATALKEAVKGEVSIGLKSNNINLTKLEFGLSSALMAMNPTHETFMVVTERYSRNVAYVTYTDELIHIIFPLQRSHHSLNGVLIPNHPAPMHVPPLIDQRIQLSALLRAYITASFLGMKTRKYYHGALGLSLFTYISGLDT